MTRRKRLRILAQIDLYFLIRYILNRPDIEHTWLFDRCREVQDNPNGHLDLWAREHYKSTIITLGLTIQDLLKNPELTVGIFSHTRGIAKGFLRQLKREFESNEKLKSLYPEIFWNIPHKESPKWSEDDGLILKRKGNPKESTIEAWGLVDGQPTGKHFQLLIYDDVVTLESVRSSDMIKKTTQALGMSYNLGVKVSAGGQRRFIGTRYHYNDTYKEILSRDTATSRIYPATEDGTIEGEPVLLTRRELNTIRRDSGPYVFACQQLQNPSEDSKQGFQKPWLEYYDSIDKNDWEKMNRYILVDPANEKKKENDYTSMWVVGLAEDLSYYWLDVIRDRLNLVERAEALFDLHKKWRPLAVGYEKYGMQADVEHIEEKQKRENYRFKIVPLASPVPKLDRIRKLIPLYEQKRMILPRTLYRMNYEGMQRDLVHDFVHEEYLAFPVGTYDMLDSQARILDKELNAKFAESQQWQTQISNQDIDVSYIL